MWVATHIRLQASPKCQGLISRMLTVDLRQRVSVANIQRHL